MLTPTHYPNSSGTWVAFILGSIDDCRLRKILLEGNVRGPALGNFRPPSATCRSADIRIGRIVNPHRQNDRMALLVCRSRPNDQHFQPHHWPRRLSLAPNLPQIGVHQTFLHLQALTLLTFQGKCARLLMAYSESSGCLSLAWATSRRPEVRNARLVRCNYIFGWGPVIS